MGLSFEAQQRKKRETKKIRLGTLSPSKDRGASRGGFKTRMVVTVAFLCTLFILLIQGQLTLSKVMFY